MPALGQRGGDPVDLAGHADADRVADADLVGAHVDQAQADVDHGRHRHAARERAAERGRNVRPFPPGELGRPGEHGLERSQRFGDRHPDVALRELVAGGGEYGQCAGAGRLSAVHAAHVRDEHRVARPGEVGANQGRQQLVRVGQLGDRRRRYEARRLDLAKACVAQQPDVLELRIERDGSRFVLQAVARPDFVDPHARGQGHGCRV